MAFLATLDSEGSGAVVLADDWTELSPCPAEGSRANTGGTHQRNTKRNNIQATLLE